MPIFDFCVYPDYEEKRYRFLIEPLDYTSFVPRIFADRLQKEMENNSEKYMVLTHGMKALQPLSVQRLQRYTCLLHTEIQEYKGASMNTIKPVHVITKETQEKYFRKMVEGPVYTVPSEDAPLSVAELSDSSTLTIALKGRLDTATAPELDARIKTELDGVEKLVFDLKDLEYVTSAGLRVLLQAQKIMSARGGMTIINANKDILDVFDATGFSEILTIV
jgi:anti-sigma B factor antagonist